MAQRRAQRSERGASATEYALVLVGIAALIVIAVFALGPVVKEMFSDTCDRFDDEMSNSATCSS